MDAYTQKQNLEVQFFFVLFKRYEKMNEFILGRIKQDAVQESHCK